MAAPTLIRTQTSGDKTTVRMLLAHEMESGQRKDAGGKPVPAWYIQQVQATLNGRLVFSAQWGPSMAKNPYLQFSLRGARPGDRLALRWQDNRGEQRSDEVVLA